jgi:hypothetical protein
VLTLVSHSLTWPAIIAGCSVDGAARQWLLTLLEGFKWVQPSALHSFVLPPAISVLFIVISSLGPVPVNHPIINHPFLYLACPSAERIADPRHRSQCCFDIETASRIIQEVWRRVDAGEQRADWKPVCDDFGLQVL